MIRKLIIFAVLVASAAVLTGSAAGQTRGLYIIENSTDTLVSVLDGVVTGEIEIEEGSSTGTLEIFWLDNSLASFQPSGTGDSLNISLSDLVELSSSKITTWTYTLSSIGEHGIYSATFALYVGGSLDYTSPSIEVHVEGAHAEAEGLRLVQNGDTLVWVDAAVVTGEVELHHGETSDPIHVWFKDINGDLFQPEHPDEFWLVGSMADSTIANFVTLDSANWNFTLEGLLEGMTDMTLGIFHDGHADYTAPAIEVHVVEEHAEAEGFRLVHGTDTLVWVDGATVTGHVGMVTGETVGPLDIWFIDHHSDLFQPESVEGFFLHGSVADTSMAKLVSFDTTSWTVTLEGFASGTTSLDLGITHDGHFDYGPQSVPVGVNTLCCDERGDINRMASIDIADLVYLVAYMFEGGPPPPCIEDADVNGDGGAIPDIADLVYLVAYMFSGGPAPVSCS